MKLTSPSAVLCLAVFTSSALAGRPATIFVPQDQPTIQAGIDAAANGDIVLVSPGTYQENINFNGKAIAVKSKKGAAHTIIDGGMNGSVVTFNSGETVNATLSGFTVQNGRGTVSFGTTEGGGIEISNASPEISKNVITKNDACDGSGINITNFGSPLIKQNTIVGNSSGACGSLGGGGIGIFSGGSPRIIGNTISENLQPYSQGGGISINYMTGIATIENNVITRNTASGSGGGIYAVNQADANVIQNIISENTAGAGAGIYWSIPDGHRGPFLVNNTIVGNTNTQTCLDCQGSALYIQGFFSQSLLINNLFIGAPGQTALFCDTTYTSQLPVVQFNDAFSPDGIGFAGGCATSGNAGGNISEDPRFVGHGLQPYVLRVGSPAIGVGLITAPDLPQKDIAGNPRIVEGKINLGVYESVFQW
jgi:parallel beta-helix repeat protein